MSSKNIFEDFDNLKSELEEKLKKIKELQSEIKDSLQQNKDHKILLKNIDEMKNSINSLKTQILNNIDNKFQDIMNNAKSFNTDELNELQNKIVSIPQSTKNEDNS